MRRYGAGSVFPQKRRNPETGELEPTGKWIAQWESGRADGRRRRRNRVADSEAEGWRKMRAAQRAEPSSPSLPRTESVGAYLERWLREVVTPTRRERTLVGYRAIVANVTPELRSLDAGDPLLPAAIQVFLDRLGKHPRTVHHYAACLKAAFGPMKLRLPAVGHGERIPLTADELRRFLAATEKHPLHALFVTAGWTGMRQGEVLGLRWQDVSLARGSLVVRSSLTRLPRRSKREHTRYRLTDPKTDKSRRTIPLLPEVVTALETVRKGQLAAVRPDGYVDQGLVFCTAHGSPLDGTNVTRAFQYQLVKAGLPRVRFHDMRHGAASLLIEAGVDLATVSALLGHSNIATTVDLYGHLTEGHKAAAVARLAGVG